MITSPMSFASTPARAIASRMTTAPRSTADTSLNTPPNEPIGVRHALKMTASSIKIRNRQPRADPSRTAQNLQQPVDPSRSEFRPIPELFQRIWIRERVAVLDRAAVNDVADRQLHDFPALC